MVKHGQQQAPSINTREPMHNDGVPRQPHERDQTPDAQDQHPRGVIEQAASDLGHGLVDTDARNTPGLPPQGAAGEAEPLPQRHESMRGAVAPDAKTPGATPGEQADPEPKRKGNNV